MARFSEGKKVRGVLAGWIIVLEIFTDTKIWVKILGTTRMEKALYGLNVLLRFLFFL